MVHESIQMLEDTTVLPKLQLYYVHVDESSEIFIALFALYTCCRFLGRLKPVFAFITPPWSFSMLVNTLVPDLYSESFLMRYKILALFGGKWRLDFFLCSYREMSTGLHVYDFRTNTEQRLA